MFGGGFSVGGGLGGGIGGGSYYRYGEAAAPVASSAPNVFNVRGFKCFGVLLALMAAITLSLGIANVVMTREAYCNPWDDMGPAWCSTTKEPYIWTWVASGIWCSVPIFLTGLLAMCLSNNPHGWTRWFSLFVFLSAIVFAPGMAVLSSIEVWRGATSDYNFYTLSDGVKQGSIWTDDDNPYQAKFALPLVIAIMACIMFIMTAIVTMELCCCSESIGVYANAGISVGGPRIMAPPAQEVYYPSRPQITNQVEVYSPGYYQPPVRYNPIGTGVSYGNFPSRAGFGANIGASVGAGIGSAVYGGGARPAYRWY